MSKPLWRQRNFMLLWSGQLVSWLGTEVSEIALPLVVLGLTGSPAQAGAVAGIRGLVYVVWAIPAGVLIDHWDRRRVMVVANLGSGCAMGSIALALYFDRLSLAQLFIASAVEGSFFVFANLGRFAALPNVVSKEQFPAAAAQTGTADQIARLVGPPLSGFLYQTVGGFVTFTLDTLSYVVNALSLFAIDVPLRAPAGSAQPQERRALRHEIAAGIGWLWRQPVLRFLNLLTAGRTVVAAGLYLLIIVIVRENGSSSLSIGLIFTVGAAGGILGSLVAARLHRRFPLRQRLLGVTLLSFIVFAFYAVAGNNALLAANTALFYAIDPTYTVTTSSYAAATIPDALRGRVTSLTRLVVLAANSFGFFITGILVQYVGSAWTIGAGAGLLLCLFVITALYTRLAEV